MDERQAVLIRFTLDGEPQMMTGENLLGRMQAMQKAAGERFKLLSIEYENER